MNNKDKNIELFQRLRSDFPFYAERNIKIKDKRSRLMFLSLNKMQLRLWKLFQEDMETGKPIRWYLVKMRQGGATVFFTALFYWLCSLRSNRNALLVAHDEIAAKGLMIKVQNYHLRSQSFLKPQTRIINRKELYFANSVDVAEATGDLGLDSRIDASTIDSETIGRSFTYQYALLTEFALYPELGINIYDRMSSLFEAVPETEQSVIVLESTAKGENDAKDYWYDDSNGFRKIFISSIASEEYRKEIDINEYFELSELPDSRYGDELKEREDIRKELSFWYPELKEEYEIEHEIMCRLYWRRHKIDTSCNGDKKRFKHEYPTTVEGAFESSSNTVFPIDRIIELEEYNKLNNLKSKQFRYHHDDQTKDKSRKFYEAKYGPLHIYNAPEEGATYVIGSDGAQGIEGGDESSAIVFKLPELEEVAYISDHIIPEEFAGILNYLSLLYNKALLGVEINDKGGYAVIEKLVNFYHYPHLYYAINPLQSKVSNNVRYGWMTNPITRPIMINDFTSLLENGDLILKSKKLLTQMKSFVIINNKPQAAYGKHDDLVIAAMVAVQMAKATHIKREHKPIIKSKFSVYSLHKQLDSKHKLNNLISSRRTSRV